MSAPHGLERARRSAFGPGRPRLRLQEAGDEPVERHATWTELFFDLVFVVAVAQLADGLHADASLSGAVAFTGLFVPVWWTWTTYAYVADLFDGDEGVFRVVLLGAMLLVAGLAATIPDAFDGRTAGFVVAYALLRADLVALYAWACATDRGLRRLIGPHLVGFSVGGLLWLGSLAVGAPGRYAIWALAIAVDLLTGLVAYLRGGDVPRHRSHMPERFGLFTLIVLGESVIAVSLGTARADWAVGSVLTAILGFALAAALWWMYFARFDADVFNWALAGGTRERRRSFVFGYGHLVVFAAIAAVGVGVWLGIEEAIRGGHATHAAPVLGIALAGALTGLSLVQSAAPGSLPSATLARRAALVVGAVALAAVGGRLSALALMALVAGAVGAETVLEAR
jgi:low temperature requirement protein LtrA